MIQIRAFQKPDQAATRELIEAGLGEHFGYVDSSMNPDLDDIYAHYIAAQNCFFVAECNSEIIGATGMIFFRKEAKLVRVASAKAHRRTGTATSLLKHCIKMAQKAGVSRLIAHTQPEWSDALGFYEHHGFHQFGKDEVDVHLQLTLPVT